MNYDSVIIELLTRVQLLERQIEDLKGRQQDDEVEDRTSTSDIFDYIIQQKQEAEQRGETSLVLRAGDVEKAVGLRNRITMVVNAMKKAMDPGDKILSSTPSGFSTTFKVEYRLNK